MFKHLLISLALFCCISVTTLAEPLTLNEVLEATCLVTSSDGSTGTGTCISHKNRQYQILTAAHVVSGNSAATVEFFRRGLKTDPIPATVSWSHMTGGDNPTDFAIISVDEKHFGKHPPRVIPLVPSSFKIKVKDYIISGGCAEGRWATGWEGIITAYGEITFPNGYKTKGISFYPPPLKGQSGSGICVLYENKKGEIETRVAAVLVWRLNGWKQIKNRKGFEKSKGGAIPVSTLYEIIKASKKAKK